MTAAQFRRALLELGLDTQEDAARVLGISRRTVIRHFADETPVPLYVQRLIELLRRYGIPKEFR